MERFYCPYAVLKNAFPNLMCKKKIERNGTRYNEPLECFEAACDHQDLCTCRKQPQNTRDFRNCVELKKKKAPEPVKETVVLEAIVEETVVEENPAEKPAKKTTKKKTKKAEEGAE